MKSVAPHDRPREKLQRLGAAALGDNELVAVILGSGQAAASALDLGNAVLARTGGIDGLARARHDELMHVPGIGAAARPEPRITATSSLSPSAAAPSR